MAKKSIAKKVLADFKKADGKTDAKTMKNALTKDAKNAKKKAAKRKKY